MGMKKKEVGRIVEMKSPLRCNVTGVVCIVAILIVLILNVLSISLEAQVSLLILVASCCFSLIAHLYARIYDD